MDTETRIEAAKARLEKNRELLVLAKQAGPPCADCRYFIPEKTHSSGRSYERREGPFCSHLAYTEQQFSVLDGQVTQEVHVSAIEARAADGLCGFEAVLFEPKVHPLSPSRRAVKLVLDATGLGFFWLISGFIFWELVYEGFK